MQVPVLKGSSPGGVVTKMKRGCILRSSPSLMYVMRWSGQERVAVCMDWYKITYIYTEWWCGTEGVGYFLLYFRII